MLSRHANNLYWLSRQIERAENTARLLDVTYQMSLLPYRITDAAQSWAEPWSLPLVINGLAKIYYERYPGPGSTFRSSQTYRTTVSKRRTAVDHPQWLLYLCQFVVPRPSMTTTGTR